MKSPAGSEQGEMGSRKCGGCLSGLLIPLALWSIIVNILLYFPNGQTSYASSNKLTNYVWYFEGICFSGIMVSVTSETWVAEGSVFTKLCLVPSRNNEWWKNHWTNPGVGIWKMGGGRGAGSPWGLGRVALSSISCWFMWLQQCRKLDLMKVCGMPAGWNIMSSRTLYVGFCCLMSRGRAIFQNSFYLPSWFL